MTAERDERLGRIDREIIDALRMAPPAELLPRVRARLANTPVEPPSRVGWMALAACGAAGALVLSIAYVKHEAPMPAETPVAIRTSPMESQPSQAAVASATMNSVETKRGPEHHVAAAVTRDVIRPSSDLVAIDQFVTALEEGLVVPGSLADPNLTVSLSEIAIVPLSIDPLNLSE